MQQASVNHRAGTGPFRALSYTIPFRRSTADWVDVLWWGGTIEVPLGQKVAQMVARGAPNGIPLQLQMDSESVFFCFWT